MAYDEGLAERLRAALAGTEGVTEKKMFGGIAFMVRGNMCCGVSGDDLMVRVGPDNYAAALLRPHAREMDFTGRPLKGMAFVDAAGLESDEDLAGWARMCTDFMETLPSK